jgi:transposase-like protein
MATILVNCRFCNQSNAVRKHGKGAAGYQGFRCLDCQRTFQLDYA